MSACARHRVWARFSRRDRGRNYQHWSFSRARSASTSARRARSASRAALGSNWFFE